MRRRHVDVLKDLETDVHQVLPGAQAGRNAARGLTVSERAVLVAEGLSRLPQDRIITRFLREVAGFESRLPLSISCASVPIFCFCI
jgi:hypothetical protein